MSEFVKSIEKSAKRFILKVYIGSHKAAERNFPFTAGPESKILMIRLNKIGDALVTTPFIHLLKQRTGARISVVADKKNYFIFKDHPDIANVYIYNKKPEKARELNKALQAAKFDVIVDLHDDVSNTASMLIGSLKIPVKAGLEKITAPLFTHTVRKKDATATHVIERCAALSTIFGFNAEPTELKINFNISDEAFSRAGEKLSRFRQTSRLLTAVNISAGSPARYWGTDRYIKLIRWLKEKGAEVIVLCDPKDKKHADDVAEEKERIISTPSFEEFAALFRYIDLLFSPDTATIHLASMFLKPVFGLYVQYNTTDVIWYPYNCDYEAVITQEPNLDNISFDDVIKKFNPFLEKYLYAKRSTTL